MIFEVIWVLDQKNVSSQILMEAFVDVLSWYSFIISSNEENTSN